MLPVASKNQPSNEYEPVGKALVVCADHEHPFRFQVPNSVSPILIVPPSSAATLKLIVSFSGMLIAPV